MTTQARNYLLMGVGVGLTVGCGAGYYAGKRANKKRHAFEIEETGKMAFRAGRKQGWAEQQDRYEAMSVYIDSNDSPEDIQRKLNQKMQAMTCGKFDDGTIITDGEVIEGGEIQKKTDVENVSGALPDGSNSDEKTGADPGTGSNSDEHSGAPAIGNADVFTVDRVPEIAKVGAAEHDILNHQVVFTGSGGTKFAYPDTLFIGPDGHLLDSIDIRNNIRRHEHNRVRLTLIWAQMGWGIYAPDPDDMNMLPNGSAIPDPDEDRFQVTDEDFENWDLSFSGDDEPEELAFEKERYLDEVERYRAHPEEGPRIISRQEYMDECVMDKIQIDYYDVDKKFAESDDLDKEIGIFDYVGVNDGDELFRHKNDPDDDDPDTIYVKNFRMNCVIEVTRNHRSYQSIRDGGAYVRDGGTD